MTRWFGRTAAAIGAVALAAAIAAPARAQTASQERALSIIRNTMSGRGYSMMKQGYGSLRDGGSSTLSVDLVRGEHYAAIGSCDNDCTDLDIRVRTPDGTVTARDILTDDSPVVEFTASTTGTFEVEVSMANCNVNPCAFGVIVYQGGNGGSSSQEMSSRGGSGGSNSGARTPSSDACAPQNTRAALVLGQPRSGSLTSESCVRPDNSFADYYRLSVPSRQSVSIAMTSGAFDAYLTLFDANGNSIESDDDGGSGTNSLITRTLDAGTYFVAANTLRRNTTGSYTLSASQNDQSFTAVRPSSGGGCEPQDTRFALVIGQPRSGSLTNDSCVRSDNTFADYYRLTVTSRQTVRIELRSGDFDAWLVLFDANGQRIEYNDDDAGGHDSRITRTLDPGTYYVAANTVSRGSTGSYTLSARTF